MRLKHPHTAVLLSLLVFLAGLVLAYWFALLHHSTHVSHERTVVTARLDKVRGEFNRQLDTIIHLSQGLVSLVKIQHGITEARFVSMAQETIASEPRIRNIALAPKNIIRFVYPMKGNERALNMDYLKNPDQREMVLRAIREKTTVVAGPVNLIQGGVGIISRTPIFTRDSPVSLGEPLYWGIASTVIDFDTLIRRTGLGDGTNHNIHFALRGKDGLGASGVTFWGDGRIFTRDPVLMDITLPSGSWQIAALPANGWPAFNPLKSFYFLFGCIFGLIFAILFFQLIRINSYLRQEIRERLDAENAVRLSEEKYRSIFENSTEGICQATLEGRFISINPAMAHMYGYESPEEMIASVTDIGTQLYINSEERVRYKALLEAQGMIKGFETPSPRKDGTTIWVSLSSHIKKDANGNALFDTMVEDITDRKQAEEKLKHTLESLRKAVGTTIQVMVSTVEARDPYTAGHQLKSANLARAIATEMGLPPEKIEGIRMAASIHDIGKISIPAEILSKPTKLSEIELMLIKEHANRGYEMLKDVVSQWPLAEIVRQHHERMDGSGYPRNLKGDDILIEARILAVADVVEAMASHRPYRPGLGIDAALNEIEKNRGIFYDNAAADACLSLFREKGFKLEGTTL